MAGCEVDGSPQPYDVRLLSPWVKQTPLLHDLKKATPSHLNQVNGVGKAANCERENGGCQANFLISSNSPIGIQLDYRLG